jgi:hypothetical protein
VCARTDTANGPSIAGPRERAGAGRSSRTGAGTWPGLCPLARNALAFIGPSIGSFRSLIIDPLRQVITSSRVSSRIRAQGLSHHADRARGNLAAKRPGEPRRWQLPTPPRLSTHDDLHDVSRDLYDVSRDLHDVSRDHRSLPRAGHSPLPLALRAAARPLGNRNRSGNASIRDQSGLDAPVTAPRFR